MNGSVSDFFAIEVADFNAPSYAGVYGAVTGYDADGNDLGSSSDLGNFGYFTEPCTDCGFRSDYEFSDSLADVETLSFVQVAEGGNVLEMLFTGSVSASGFPPPPIATPEPSAILLFGTVAALLIRRKRSIL
jgi:hypothetical protein